MTPEALLTRPRNEREYPGNEDVIMNEQDPRMATLDRRTFFKTAGAGLTAAGMMLTAEEQARAAAQADKAKLDRIASCTWPVRFIFKNRPYSGQGRSGAAPTANQPYRGNAGVSPQQMKEKYGEITMLDFPQWTKDTYPGVYHLDLWSDVFGDVTDGGQWQETKVERDGKAFTMARWDPSLPASKKWLDKLADTLVKTGTKVQHISNNAPFALADFGSPEADARRFKGNANFVVTERGMGTGALNQIVFNQQYLHGTAQRFSDHLRPLQRSEYHEFTLP